jgi:hypothetical protein
MRRLRTGKVLRAAGAGANSLLTAQLLDQLIAFAPAPAM